MLAAHFPAESWLRYVISVVFVISQLSTLAELIMKSTVCSINADYSG